MNLAAFIARRLPLAQRLGVDKSVGYLLAARIVQIGFYVILMMLIARYFTAKEQGYYYTFLSLLALQVFVDLGLAIVIVNSASHEWAFLHTDKELRISGDRKALSRLVSLGRTAFKWYGIAMLLFVPAVGIAGWIFFSQDTASSVDWRHPWSVLVVLAGLMIGMTPFNAILEGCNQIEKVNRTKLEQVMLESLAVCLGAVLGAGLWCAAISVAVRFARSIYLWFIEYRNFFIPFWRAAVDAKVDWAREIWPMQWRLGVSALVTYFLNSLYNPVMFHYQGAEVAGQTGMTLQMLTGLSVIAMSWITTKVPSFGALVAKKRYAELDDLWRRVSLISLGMIFGGAVVFWLTVCLIKSTDFAIAHRILDPLPTAVFLAATIIAQFVQCLVSYLRAHRREPIMMASVSICLGTGFLVWLWGSRWGPLGAAIGYLTIISLGAIWIWEIWKRCRREWHAA